jgi:hypothetical protein
MSARHFSATWDDVAEAVERLGRATDADLINLAWKGAAE